jgi:type II secretory pathway predicted ATPase ExeA
VDPFGLTSDPCAYVARPACEAALAELERLVRSGSIAALSGPPGIGKTLLLRVLERRLSGSLRSVYVPYGALGFAELCQLVLGLLELPVVSGGDAGLELAAQSRRAAARGEPLLLLLDDANAIPLATLRALVAATRSLGGALRLLAVPVDDARAARVLAALGVGVGHVRFAEPMSPAETASYVAGRLALSDESDSAPTSLTPDRVSWLHRESAGIPRRLHQLVAWILHRDGPAPDSIAPFSDAAAWLELDRVR